MDEISKQIEELAEKMEKSSTTPNERLFDVIKSLGKDGLKAKLETLSDDEKLTLKSALEEMNLKKAVSFDKEAQSAKHIQGKFTDTIIQEEIASDDADEKLVKPEANQMNHQGTPTDGWSGQVIKSIQENEQLLEQVVEKAMDKCGDDKMVMKKLKEKGMDESKVQGALEKYKAKKEVKKSEDLEKGKMKEAREEAKEKIMQMEEKEHGTKDPKKLVEAEKKEDKEKKDKPKMKKSTSWEDETRLLKANTLGRNFNFNVETFINEALKLEGQEGTPVKKSEGKEDLNDIIEKSMDRNWDQVNHQRSVEEHKTSGTLVKSFEVKDLAATMGISEDEAKKILGE